MLAAGLVASGSARAGTFTFSLSSIGDFDNPVYVDDDGVNEDLAFVVEQPGRIQVARDGEKLDKPFLDIRDIVALRRRAGPAVGRLRPRLRRQQPLLRLLRQQQRRHPRRPVQAQEADQGRSARLAPEGDRRQARPGRQPQRRPAAVRPRRQPLHGHRRRRPPAGPRGRRPAASTACSASCCGSTPKAKGGYKVPPTTRSSGGPGKDEIYALGLRNPYRFSFDSGNGALTIGDVGGSDWEEVDYVTDPTARA